MKANYQAVRGFLRLPAVLAILAAMPLLAARAADPGQGGISKDDLEKALSAERAKLDARDALGIVGAWKNTNRDMTTATMTFSEAGDFEFKLEKNGESKVDKGLYKVTAKGDSLIVSVFLSKGKDYFSVTSLSKERAAWQDLKSATEKPDPKKAVIWTRGQAAADGAEASPPPKNAKGKELFDLQSPENLIGRWKSVSSDGVVGTTSFSETGEFSYAKEKNGKRDDDPVTASYTVKAMGGHLVVTLADGDDKAYYGIAFLSKDRCFKQLLKSPDDPIDTEKKGIILNRMP